MAKLLTALCAALLLCGAAQASLWGRKRGIRAGNTRAQGYPAADRHRRRRGRKAPGLHAAQPARRPRANRGPLAALRRALGGMHGTHQRYLRRRRCLGAVPPRRRSAHPGSCCLSACERRCSPRSRI